MKKALLSLLGIVLLFTLSGCGESKELKEYEEKMSLFTEELETSAENLSSIDPNEEGAVETMLLNLDNMNDSFQYLAEIPVPSKFSAVEALADDAANYMSEAVSLYHEAYDGEEFLEGSAKLAKENYNRAMKRISYISALLQGQMPEGDGVTVEESETDFTPYEEEAFEEESYEEEWVDEAEEVIE